MESHISLLLVVVPLIAAPLVAVLPRGRWSWAIATIVSALCAVFAVAQLWAVLYEGTIIYELGGWAPPWGIEYRIDAVNAFAALIVAAIAAVTLPYALLVVEREISEEKIPLFYSALLLCLAGLLGITQTGDIFNVFVFLEISALSTYALVSLGKQRQALTAAYQYLIMGTVGATFYLIGVGLIYSATGSLNMHDLSILLPEALHPKTVETGFAFLMIGIALKLALFPLHLWLPNAYTYAPTVVTVFLAATATKVAMYLMLRILFTVFPQGFAIASPAEELLIIAGIAGIIIASVSAIYQDDIKRLLAYSSVAQIGYMALGAGLASLTSVTATMVHMFNHAMMKGALFMAVGAIIYRVGACRMENIHGLGKSMPWTFGAIIIGGLSLVGVPGTAGFISKWYLVVAALEQEAWISVLAIVIGSLLAVVYVGKLIEALYFKPITETNKEVKEAPMLLLVPTWVLVIANIYFGLDTTLTVGVASEAATALLGEPK